MGDIFRSITPDPPVLRRRVFVPARTGTPTIIENYDKYAVAVGTDGLFGLHGAWSPLETSGLLLSDVKPDAVHVSAYVSDVCARAAAVADARMERIAAMLQEILESLVFTDTIENAAPYVADVCHRAACIAEARHRRFLGMLLQMLEEMRRDSGSV